MTSEEQIQIKQAYDGIALNLIASLTSQLQNLAGELASVRYRLMMAEEQIKELTENE